MKVKYYNELPEDFDLQTLTPGAKYSQAVLEFRRFVQSGRKYCLYTCDDAKSAKTASVTVYAYMKRSGLRGQYKVHLCGERVLVVKKDEESV